MTEEKRCHTADEAIRHYRSQPGNEEAARANYFDLPVLPAAERYAASEEFAEVVRLLGPGARRAVLDLGAGNGIASYALAKAGWRVTAFEPDPSGEVGAGAIREIQRATGLPIEIEERLSDPLPFADSSFDAIFIRQVLHHVPELPATMRDLFRLLRPGGHALAVREHVVHDAVELAVFLKAHPLQALHGKENAHPLRTYLGAARAAGFKVRDVWGPIESVLNFHPYTESQRRKTVRGLARQRFFGLGRHLLGSPRFLRATARAHSRADATPGRLYSFLLAKP